MRHLDWSRLVGSAGGRVGGVLGVALITLGTPAFALAGAQTSSATRPLEIKSAAGEHTIDCEGRSVRITGATNEITLNGECPSVAITGAGNIVTIDAVDRITVNGAFNKVTWKRAVSGAKPRVSVTGTSSSVTRAEADREDASAGARRAPDAPASTAVSASAVASARSDTRESTPVERGREPERDGATHRAGSRAGREAGDAAASRVSVSRDGDLLRVLSSNGRDTVDCDGRELTVVGSDNTLTLRGDCPLVRVTGSDNTVHAEQVGRFLVTGSDNELTWTRAGGGAAPSVTNTGSGNVIRQTSRP